MLLHVHRPETAPKNQEMELIRNKERLKFFKVSPACGAQAAYVAVVLCAGCTMRCQGFLFAGFPQWCSKAFKNVTVVPPDFGSVHQVNLEYLSRVVQESEGLIYPDSVVGTDSHTTMINGLGVLGWGEWILIGTVASITASLITKKNFAQIGINYVTISCSIPIDSHLNLLSVFSVPAVCLSYLPVYFHSLTLFPCHFYFGSLSLSFFHCHFCSSFFPFSPLSLFVPFSPSLPLPFLFRFSFLPSFLSFSLSLSLPPPSCSPLISPLYCHFCSSRYLSASQV